MQRCIILRKGKGFLNEMKGIMLSNRFINCRTAKVSPSLSVAIYFNFNLRHSVLRLMFSLWAAFVWF